MRGFRHTFINLVKEALAVNNRPFPWRRAIGAGLSMALPIFIGLLLNHFQYGLIAGMGGFTYLYVFPAPYAQQAKKIGFVLLGIVLSAISGTLLSPYPFIVALTIGFIAFLGVFIFGALRMIGPSSIFFVLVFAIMADITASMEITFELIFMRAGLIFMGGSLAWIIAMMGFPFKPHGPEENVIKRLYGSLATYLDAIGTEQFNDTRYHTMATLKETEETLASAYISWYPKKEYNRLLHLAVAANNLFNYTLEHYSSNSASLPNAFSKGLKPLSQSLDHHKPIYFEEVNSLSDRDPELFEKLLHIQAIFNVPTESLTKLDIPTRFSLKTILTRHLDRNSLVFITALRFGLVTMISALVAYQFELVRSYWVPLTCVAVMSGPTMVATYHRAVQRSIGTFIGIFIAGFILLLHPNGYIIASIILIFTAITELFIVKNYALAVMFITPNALLMAESITGGTFAFSYFASARIIDTLVGGGIGLIGVALMARQTASLRIPRVIMRTLRNQSQLMLVLFNPASKNREEKLNIRLLKLKTNLENLRALYDAAIGEIPKKKTLIEYYWPIIYSIEHLTFLLEKSIERKKSLQLNETDLSQLLYLFETLANAAGHREKTSIKTIPHLPLFYAIENEIMNLQKAFNIKDDIPT